MLAVVGFGCLVELAACSPNRSDRRSLEFRDVTAASGVQFRHGAGSPEKDYILGINGGGVAIFDYDADGRPDLFFVNGSKLSSPRGDPPNGAAADGIPAPAPRSDALYRNVGGLRFEEATDAAGLVESDWGGGVAVADYDGDGDPDLYVTNWGPNRLWRNDGGRFTDVTADSGTGDPRWGTSAAFFDFDRDGLLDLFVANYLDFDPAKVSRRGDDPKCEYRGVPVACGPAGLAPAPCTLYRGTGGDRFDDVSDAAGIRSIDWSRRTYSLGVVVLDANSDGWLDLYVANDSRPNVLFVNRRDGTFEDRASESAVAYDDSGLSQAGMGVDAVFLGERSVEDLFVTNFARDQNTYYARRTGERTDAGEFFRDASAARGLAASGFATLGWATFFFDADLDGSQDLFVANGHVAPQVDDLADGGERYAQRNHLSLGDGKGSFHEVGEAVGLTARRVSRGAAWGDLDGDGDLDIVVSELDSPATILENSGRPLGHWLAVRLRGKAPRDPIGAVVEIRAGGRTQRRRACGRGRATQSHSVRVAHFGLGDATAVEEIEVTWPSGRVERFGGGGVDRVVVFAEGAGS